MRLRTRSSMYKPPLALGYQRYIACDPSWVQYSTRQPASQGEWQEMLDVSIPGFHRRSERGEVFFNPLTRIVRSYQETGSGWAIKARTSHDCGGTKVYAETKWDGLILSQGINGTPNSVTGGIDGPSLISDEDVRLAETEASTACLANRSTASFNMFEDLAELHQTVGLFNITAQKLLTQIQRLRKNPIDFAATSVPNAYLAWRYGISPLVHDLASIAHDLGKIGRKIRQTSRGSASAYRYERSVSTLAFGAGTVATDIVREVDDRVDCRAMSLDELNFTLADALGMSVAGFLTVPWELVSYSFVIDWFINLGDLLQAYSPAPGVTPLGGCVVTRRSSKTIWQAGSSVPSSSYELVRATEGIYTSLRNITTRRALSDPALVLRADFKFARWTRMSDLLAILAQQFFQLTKHR